MTSFKLSDWQNKYQGIVLDNLIVHESPDGFRKALSQIGVPYHFLRHPEVLSHACILVMKFVLVKYLYWTWRTLRRSCFFPHRNMFISRPSKRGGKSVDRNMIAFHIIGYRISFAYDRNGCSSYYCITPYYFLENHLKAH
jgi:hypothetical protein